ncbi:MAG: T9SS type A sorting domain-containing protein, partial [Chlorobi bacterium]|nr:T9SS type A sorting domain-containing protein [Chlorobiota bacterium]
IIENNIFYRAKESPLYLASGGLSPMTVNYNDWYQDNDGQVTFELPNDIYTKGQFSQYKNRSGLDANSIIDDPLLSGYNLTKDSPCIDAGNPESPLDGDGTIADIGALYFNQQKAALESTEEHITINEGDNYQGWTTTGQYQRVLASTSGADSVVVTILTVDHKVGNDDRNPLKPLNVVVFPNPADDNVTVRFSGIPAKGTQIELLDINGRIVFRKVAVSTYERINIESQLPGTYFVRTTFGKNHIVDTLIIR